MPRRSGKRGQKKPKAKAKVKRGKVPRPAAGKKVEVPVKRRVSPRRAARKGTRAEHRVARALGVERVGGPGRPDFVLEGVPGENKHWAARPVHAGMIRKAHRHGSGIVNASGRKGFTKGAKRLARDLGIRLMHRRR